MPTYDYKCYSCGKVVEIMHPMSESPVLKCLSCGKQPLYKQIAAPKAIIFKGSGWTPFFCKTAKDYK